MRDGVVGGGGGFEDAAGLVVAKGAAQVAALVADAAGMAGFIH